MTHLGAVVDLEEMKFSVVKRKAENGRRLSIKLPNEVRFGRRWVYVKALSSFCGTCISLSLEMP